MALNHGINTKKSGTNYISVTEASVGIPFYFGAAPVHIAADHTDDLVLVKNFDEAVKKLGYSDDWETWPLCEGMYAHLKLFAMGPVIFCNVFDPVTNVTAAAATDYTVTNHAVRLDGYIDNANLVVKNGETAVPAADLVKTYDGTTLVVAIKSTSTHYSATVLNIAGDVANTEGITDTQYADALERAEECKTLLGTVPDLIVAPQTSVRQDIAALMAAKAANINGLFRGKAVVDISTDDAADWDEVHTAAGSFADENMIVCWPMAKVGDKLFHMSSIVTGLISQTDAENGGIPYESPSNKLLPITASTLGSAADDEITLTVGQADTVSYNSGVVTALNYNGWRSWGNYTGCRTAGETDVAKVYICTSRMMDYICNTFTNTFWNYLDKPLSSVLIDAIVNSFNSWLAGLTREGALLGGEIQYIPDNNPTADLLAGKFRLDAAVASPVPAQRMDMVVEFDVDLLVGALNV